VSVKRYDPEIDSGTWIRSDEGGWVSYEDYAKLEAELATLRAEVAHWRGNAKNTVSKELYLATCGNVDRLRQDNDTIRTAAQRVVDEWNESKGSLRLCLEAPIEQLKKALRR
jgi:hypothetical protein